MRSAKGQGTGKTREPRTWASHAFLRASVCVHDPRCYLMDRASNGWQKCAHSVVKKGNVYRERLVKPSKNVDELFTAVYCKGIRDDLRRGPDGRCYVSI